MLAILISAGVAQTCKGFGVSGKSCGAVFGAGFFAGDKGITYQKNINTINAAIGASWVALLLWVCFTGFEFS